MCLDCFIGIGDIVTKTTIQAFDDGYHQYVYGKRIQLDSTIYNTDELQKAFALGYHTKKGLEFVDRNSIIGAYGPKDQSMILTSEQYDQMIDKFP